MISEPGGRLEFADVEKTFPSRSGLYRVFSPVSLDVESGSFVALVGPSGCGKSTLLRLVAGLEDSTSGGIFLDGREIEGPGPDRGMVFQDYALLPWMTVLENVLFALDCNAGGRSREECRAEAYRCLDVVHLSRFADRRPYELSGGMKQRVGLARAFALNPKIMLMDEPFGALDALTRGVMQAELLQIWENSNRTVLLVTHDVDEALFLADRIVVLSQGPAARIKADVEVPFERPREREEILASPEYPVLHKELMGVLSQEIVA